MHIWFCYLKSVLCVCVCVLTASKGTACMRWHTRFKSPQSFPGSLPSFLWSSPYLNWHKTSSTRCGKRGKICIYSSKNGYIWSHHCIKLIALVCWHASLKLWTMIYRKFPLVCRFRCLRQWASLLPDRRWREPAKAHWFLKIDFTFQVYFMLSPVRFKK